MQSSMRSSRRRSCGAGLAPSPTAREARIVPKAAGKSSDFSFQLGNEQMRFGNVNPRTEMWVIAFATWEKAGV
jgi:hypothetical protein